MSSSKKKKERAEATDQVEEPGPAPHPLRKVRCPVAGDMQLWAVLYWNQRKIELPCWFQGKQLAWKGGTVSTSTQILIRYEGADVSLTWPVQQRLQRLCYRNIATMQGLQNGGGVPGNQAEAECRRGHASAWPLRQPQMPGACQTAAQKVCPAP
jgi:hypothetical protein